MTGPRRGPEDHFSPGDWNAICSICGTKGKASEMVRNWQGMMRHPKCDEPRHPQDFVIPLAAKEMMIPWAQPDADTDNQICTFNGCSAIAGVGMAGCMISGNSNWDSSQWAAGSPLPTDQPSWFLTPVVLSASIGDTGQDVILSWTRPTATGTIQGYRIYNASTHALIVDTGNPNLTYDITGLSATTQYSYYVTAYDTAGHESRASNTVTITTYTAVQLLVNESTQLISGTWTPPNNLWQSVDIYCIGGGMGGNFGADNGGGPQQKGYGGAGAGYAYAKGVKPPQLAATVYYQLGYGSLGTVEYNTGGAPSGGDTWIADNTTPAGGPSEENFAYLYSEGGLGIDRHPIGGIIGGSAYANITGSGITTAAFQGNTNGAPGTGGMGGGDFGPGVPGTPATLLYAGSGGNGGQDSGSAPTPGGSYGGGGGGGGGGLGPGSGQPGANGGFGALVFVYHYLEA